MNRAEQIHTPEADVHETDIDKSLQVELRATHALLIVKVKDWLTTQFVVEGVESVDTTKAQEFVREQMKLFTEWDQDAKAYTLANKRLSDDSVAVYDKHRQILLEISTDDDLLHSYTTELVGCVRTAALEASIAILRDRVTESDSLHEQIHKLEERVMLLQDSMEDRDISLWGYELGAHPRLVHE